MSDAVASKRRTLNTSVRFLHTVGTGDFHRAFLLIPGGKAGAKAPSIASRRDGWLSFTVTKGSPPAIKYGLAHRFPGEHGIAADDASLHRHALEQFGGDGYPVFPGCLNRHLPEHAGHGVAIGAQQMHGLFGVAAAAKRFAVHGDDGSGRKSVFGPPG
ncbi:MAG: hypothetical protein LBJ46_01510 [Planctomycetota bacterium]|nr:hypothetical protein [Planctomycetota bacterium]